MTVKKEVKVPNLRYLRDKDAQPVKGKFIFHEVPGGKMSFSFRKWKEDPVVNYDLVDGEIYTIPLGVAIHLNQNCKYPVHSYAMGENGQHKLNIGQWIRRCSFQSLEFLEIENLTPIGDAKLKEA